MIDLFVCWAPGGVQHCWNSQQLSLNASLLEARAGCALGSRLCMREDELNDPNVGVRELWNPGCWDGKGSTI